MRILVVDDEPAVREAVGRALRLEGHDVALAGDGGQALHALKAWPPDAVVLDVLMPRVDRKLPARGSRPRARHRQLVIPVQQFRSRIEPVRPNDGSCLVVHADLPEIRGIAQWLPKRAVKQERAIDVAHDAVVEGDS
jgi:two-component system, OmpR family, response regulator MprA